MQSNENSAPAPRIGYEWIGQGGIYAGIVGGENGEPDYHLIHATIDHEIDDTTWDLALIAAKAPLNGFDDWSLPDRREPRLLSINSADSFDTDCWYWTATQCASNTDYAWVQHFYGGYQSISRKSNEYRARAVRRILIIQ